MYDQSSPVETPTTPSTPSFPLFAASPTHPHSNQPSIPSIQTITPAAQRCSSTLPPNTTPTNTSTADGIPILRPFPLRPAVPTHKNNNNNNSNNRISKPSQQRPRRFSRIRSPSPTLHTRTQPLIRTISPDGHGHGHREPLTYPRAVRHLATTLIPLISVTTGLAHPAFPRSLLQYHLLTHAQLDELARYYHQIVPPVRETGQYPVSIPAWVGRDGEERDGEERGGQGEVDLAKKRRRWGRFSGLRGCESPTMRSLEEAEEEREWRERLEREWRRGIERRREEERLRGKVEGWRERW